MKTEYVLTSRKVKFSELEPGDVFMVWDSDQPNMKIKWGGLQDTPNAVDLVDGELFRLNTDVPVYKLPNAKLVY